MSHRTTVVWQGAKDMRDTIGFSMDAESVVTIGDDEDVGFPSQQDVVVKALPGENWELMQCLTYRGKWETFVVPAGTKTDFASVPRVFVWFIPKYGPYTKAAILHDYLWREL